MLESLKIPYKVVVQRAGEVVVTFPWAAHQGFSHGITVAEAINYSESDPCDNIKYRTCTRICSSHPITAEDIVSEKNECVRHDRVAKVKSKVLR